MAERPAITNADLIAALRDGLARTRGEGVDAWVEREGFEKDALVGAAYFLVETWRASGQPVQVLALHAFMVAWDAHRDLRGERADHVYAICFDQDTFGLFTTREGAERDLAEQIKQGGPAWDDCKVVKWRVRDG